MESRNHRKYGPVNYLVYVHYNRLGFGGVSGNFWEDSAPFRSPKPKPLSYSWPHSDK